MPKRASLSPPTDERDPLPVGGPVGIAAEDPRDLAQVDRPLAAEGCQIDACSGSSFRGVHAQEQLLSVRRPVGLVLVLADIREALHPGTVRSRHVDAVRQRKRQPTLPERHVLLAFLAPDPGERQREDKRREGAGTAVAGHGPSYTAGGAEVPAGRSAPSADDLVDRTAECDRIELAGAVLPEGGEPADAEREQLRP
jgi:hypothetical protein